MLQDIINYNRRHVHSNWWGPPVTLEVSSTVRLSALTIITAPAKSVQPPVIGIYSHQASQVTEFVRHEDIYPFLSHLKSLCFIDYHHCRIIDEIMSFEYAIGWYTHSDIRTIMNLPAAGVISHPAFEVDPWVIYKGRSETKCYNRHHDRSGNSGIPCILPRGLFLR